MTTYVFSRLFGMGRFWKTVMQDDDLRPVKDMSEAWHGAVRLWADAVRGHRVRRAGPAPSGGRRGPPRVKVLPAGPPRARPEAAHSGSSSRKVR